MKHDQPSAASVFVVQIVNNMPAARRHVIHVYQHCAPVTFRSIAPESAMQSDELSLTKSRLTLKQTLSQEAALLLLQWVVRSDFDKCGPGLRQRDICGICNNFQVPGLPAVGVRHVPVGIRAV